MTTQIRGGQIQDTIAGDALVVTSGILDVQVDDSTIEVSGDTLQAKVAGIDHNALTNYTINEHRTINDSGSGSTDLWSADKITTLSGNLQTNIDGKDNYQSWSFAVGGVTKDAITSNDVLDFVGDGTVTITRSTDDQITISGSGGAGDIAESDYSLEDESSNCDGSTVAFTLDNTAISGSLQVYLNGLIQQRGSGKDYTYSSTTVTFTVAPDSDDILLIHYVAQ